MHIRCWAELEAYGALDIMRREYGNLLSATPEPEYNVSLEIDLAVVPPEGGALGFLCNFNLILTCTATTTTQ